MKNIDLKAGMGCACKIESTQLHKVLSKIPKVKDDNLIVGYNTSDDGAVYKLTDEIAMIQTLDFFTPMSEDPYLFGQIAAANALSDIYAMGGDVVTALNIVCFPQSYDDEVLEQILKGGASKVHEANASLVGGHSINDDSLKYGLSVCGIVHPDNILSNANAKVGDVIIQTKPLGVGIINTGNRVGEASKESFDMAIKCMTTLNKYAVEILKQFDIHACTDITGFGLAGHALEIAKSSGVALEMNESDMYYIPQAKDLAAEFITSAAGQKNRNDFGCRIDFSNLSFASEEILFDAQTSGGLLVTLAEKDAPKAIEKLSVLDIPSKIIGRVCEKQTFEIVFKGE